METTTKLENSSKEIANVKEEKQIKEEPVNSKDVNDLSAVKMEIKSDLFVTGLKTSSEINNSEASDLSGTKGDPRLAALLGYASVFNNGKELNGGFPLGSSTGVCAAAAAASALSEKNWFSVVPREPCDITTLTNNNNNTLR